MKKEIMKLLKSESGSFRINNICYLSHYTTNVISKKVDMLVLEFNNINHVCFGYTNYEIKSRDYEGIIEECSQAITNHLQEVNEQLVKNLKAGYRNATRM